MSCSLAYVRKKKKSRNQININLISFYKLTLQNSIKNITFPVINVSSCRYFPWTLKSSTFVVLILHQQCGIKEDKRLRSLPSLTRVFDKKGRIKSRVISAFTLATQRTFLRALPVLCSLFFRPLQLVISSSNSSTFSWPWPTQHSESAQKIGLVEWRYISFPLRKLF